MLQTLKNLLGGDSTGVANNYYLLQVKAIEAKQLMRIDQNSWFSSQETNLNNLKAIYLVGTKTNYSRLDKSVPKDVNKKSEDTKKV